ncbi:MAG: 4-hydroxy-3-methylbut-2-enyl diphosphate reductase [Clostridia bacterium]|nr:4-hydroxy-3-methylbut-2-enyl diphosphate reductase [Clostridia bacterium]
MKIKIADKAGFCFGVDRAVKIAYAAADSGEKTVTYGALIHNKTVTERLSALGVSAVSDISDIQSGDNVIIRAHGISEAEQEKIEAAGGRITDATCPYVKKIHSIVRSASEEGKTVVIAGNPNHPEVMGIKGRCKNSAYVVSSAEEAEELCCRIESKEVVLVAQTTIRKDFFNNIQQILKKHFTNAEIFDTICSATKERQCAAAELAAEADGMIVVGGAESSNTRKLFELCAEHCTDTVCVENAKELIKYIKQGKFPASKKLVGITAGASTPGSVIKEVYLTMAENNEMNFAEALEETLKPIKSGEVVKGVVIGVTPTEVRVDIGNKYDGVIPFNELTDDTNADINELVKVGEEVEVYVVLVSDRDGVVTLSKKKIDAAKGMEEIKTAFENGEILSGRVIELVKGGVVSIVKGVRVFIPASECAERFLADLGSLLGTEQRFRIIKMDEDRRGRMRVVGSIKSVAKEESEKAAAAFWATAEEGKKYTGVVKSLTSFGAFVDLGGVDGLIHISELSPVRIAHPSEAVKVGDEIEVYIKELNREQNRISLVKELKEKKAEEFWNNAEIGKQYTGVIKSLTSFGAFVDLGGVDGLVHISELSWDRIKHPSEVVKEGDELTVYIKDMNKETGKVSLGYKKEEDSPWVQATKDLKVGDVIKCKVVRILPFGAFAEVAPYVDGLIHISQISNERIDKPSDVLAIGDVVDAKIVEINEDTKQIGLSMKALMTSDDAEAPAADDAEPTSYTEDSSFTLGDILDAAEESSDAE